MLTIIPKSSVIIQGAEESSRTTVIKYVGGGYTGGLVQTNGMLMLPSTARDFANNDAKTLTLDFANPTGPDSIGNYWVKGEVLNNGNSTLQNIVPTPLTESCLRYRHTRNNE
jgi:hypothetical protein